MSSAIVRVLVLHVPFVCAYFEPDFVYLALVCAFVSLFVLADNPCLRARVFYLRKNIGRVCSSCARAQVSACVCLCSPCHFLSLLFAQPSVCLCMHVYVCTCMHACVYARVHVRGRVRACHVCVCVRACVHVCVCMRVYVCTRVMCVSACVCVCACVFVFVPYAPFCPSPIPNPHSLPSCQTRVRGRDLSLPSPSYSQETDKRRVFLVWLGLDHCICIRPYASKCYVVLLMTLDSVILYNLITRAANARTYLPKLRHLYPITTILPGRVHDSVYLTFSLFAYV